MSGTSSSWQNREVAHEYLDERRKAIPQGGEQIEMLFRLVRHFVPNPKRILDLGCGDGYLARTLLSRYPSAQAVLIDHSAAMLERAAREMAPYGERCEIITGDLADPLPSQVGPSTFDLAVSRLAIHHLPHERKRSLYREVFEILAPGGLFLNIEHVAPASASLEHLFESVFVDHIAEQTGRDRHRVFEEYRNRPDKADNILETGEAQSAWLREIGFDHVDCYYKWLEIAIFGGVKPPSTPAVAAAT
jgi:tRNA (cmo5U34)-methyltransferase